jgi:cytoskeletal protein CcmA (bactofilin family)
MEVPLDLPRKEGKKKFWKGLFSPGNQTISLVNEGTRVVGTVSFGQGVVRLDGCLEGKVFGPGTLIIGEKGRLQGEVNVGTLILCGQMEGLVAASNRAHIAPTGKLLGKVQAAQLVIEEGGILEGDSLPLQLSLQCQR